MTSSWVFVGSFTWFNIIKTCAYSHMDFITIGISFTTAEQYCVMTFLVFTALDDPADELLLVNCFLNSKNAVSRIAYDGVLVI